MDGQQVEARRLAVAPLGDGPTTSGITSPARRTTTQSPTRTSFAVDLALVVERGVGHRDAADEHRLQARATG